MRETINLLAGKICTVCFGTGSERILAYVDRGGEREYLDKECSHCHGDGVDPCPDCKTKDCCAVCDRKGK